MSISRGRGRDRSTNYWPGFVDAMATLLLVIIFMLVVFMLSQFFLSQEISGRDTVLNRLNAQISELTQLLALSRGNNRDLQEQITTLQASLSSAEDEKSRLQGMVDSNTSAASQAGGRIATLEGKLSDEKRISARALSQVELLNQQISALRRQIAALEDALEASEDRDHQSQTTRSPISADG